MMDLMTFLLVKKLDEPNQHVAVTRNIIRAFQYMNFPEDIEGEIWIICIKQLHFYIPSKGKGHNINNSLERWLNRVVHNRLANLYRDRYSSVNKAFRTARMNIMNSISLDQVDTSRERLNRWSYSEDKNYQLVQQEFLSFIEGRLEPELIDVLYNCIYDGAVTSYYKAKLKEALLPIIEEWKELHGEAPD